MKQYGSRVNIKLLKKSQGYQEKYNLIRDNIKSRSKRYLTFLLNIQ